MTVQGKFIVVEGLEGAGKSSAIDSIVTNLAAQRITAISVREPGGTPIAEHIRSILKTSHEEPLSDEAELLLMYSARIQLINGVILPALAKGQWIVADRFEWSTYAYQGWGRGFDRNTIQFLSQLCVKDLQPDLIVYLDIDPGIGLIRAAARSERDRIEQESLEFFKRVQQGYHDLAKDCAHSLTVDASLPLSTVHKNIQQAIQKLLP